MLTSRAWGLAGAISVLLALLVAPQILRADDQPSGVPRWEHLELVATVRADHFIVGLPSDNKATWTANGKAVAMPREGIKYVGLHGWELVSAQIRHVQEKRYVATTQFYYWFKRPLCAGCLTPKETTGFTP